MAKIESGQLKKKKQAIEEIYRVGFNFVKLITIDKHLDKREKNYLIP